MGLFVHNPNLQPSFLELSFKVTSEEEVPSTNLFRRLLEKGTLLLVSRVSKSGNFRVLENHCVETKNNIRVTSLMHRGLNYGKVDSFPESTGFGI